MSTPLLTPTTAPTHAPLVQAYKALTDETSRTNYQKYGHPDGPQAMSGEPPTCWPSSAAHLVSPHVQKLLAAAMPACCTAFPTCSGASRQPQRGPYCSVTGPRTHLLAHACRLHSRRTACSIQPLSCAAPAAVSVALPEWFFSKDKQSAPLILLVLLFGGIVTPLGVAAWYLMGTQK